MRAFALPVLALLSVGACACGGASKSATAASKGAAATAPGGIAKSDYDKDDGRPVDDDTPSLHSYGREAGQPDKPLITALVRRYFVAAAVGDGAKGCTLIDPELARATPLDYGRYGPPYLLGSKTCAAVLTRLFRHEHPQLAAEARAFRVSSVRLEGDKGFAFLHLGKAPERQIYVRRVGGAWRIAVLADGPIGHTE